MIHFFNRKELTATFHLKEKNRICTELDAAKIDYHIKVVNRNSSSYLSDSRWRTGTLGQMQDYTYEYIIYVKRKDYSRAEYLLRNR